MLEVLNERIPTTMFFPLGALVISISPGILFGVISAVYRGQPMDTVVTLTTNIMVCPP